MRWNACALSLGLLAACYVGLAVNPLGGYVGVVAASYLLVGSCG